MKVFVIDKNKKPLSPIYPGRARILLKQGKAAVFRMFPFTIILKYAVNTTPESLRIKIDPGSRVTGIALVNDRTGDIPFAAEIEHRGGIIKKNLEKRRHVRRGRRGRLRYRKPRFLNRRRPEGWLPPSLKSRVLNIDTWVSRLIRFCPVGDISMELARFDTQRIANPEICGTEYQQGDLAGYEIREYLLEKWGRKCAYCGKENIPLEIEHIIPRSRGGTDRVWNLTVACRRCNHRKGDRPVEIFLKRKPDVLKRILSQAKTPLRDAAAVNATRWDLFQTLKKYGLPVECGSGGMTKFNRTRRGIPKSHWGDAVCVGKSTPEKLGTDGVRPLKIKAKGQGGRQKAVLNKYGQPKQHRPLKPLFGWRSGDIAKFGKMTVRVTPRKTGSFGLTSLNGGRPFNRSHKKLVRVHRSDGYKYCLC
ncbi:RNA-guided endonuclease IscB [Desulfobacterales bacterium HSG2]|nr:RNA-guided endonuclease IscB [Desulfobacterales bacterium HSG2]